MSDKRWPVTCEETQEHLLSRAADESTPAVIDDHLEGCPSCRADAARVKGLDQKLREQLGDTVVPAELWPKIVAEIRRIQSGTVRPLARQRRLPAAATIVGAAARLAGVAAVAIMLVYAELKWQWTGLPGEAELPVVTEPINDAITFRLSGRPLDVSSSSPTALASWFKGKTDFSFPTVPARLAGFKLQGIRLCYFLHRRLAAVLYQNGNRTLTLYVMSGEQLDLPADSPAQIETGPLWLRGAKGYSNLIWRDGSTVYALVSELSGRELLEIAKELQSGARSAASIELKLKTLHSEASRASDRSAESA